ncbi:hypothetical protein [Dolichospermum sp. UHCC 0259]|uniref:hypothetical protein n=1 Tax=Dolichospermum sp. UHCC 0259 TaxID=2590010 RepID=UPI00352AAEDF
MRNRQLPYFLFSLTLVIIIGFVKCLDKLPNLPCEKEGFMVSQITQSYIHPEKIVVRPWLGQHHVYAVFMLPNNYVYDEFMKVNLPVNKTFCGIAIKFTQAIDDINLKPDHYLVRGYLQTRTALKYIFAGKMNDLKQINNWQLGYGKLYND